MNARQNLPEIVQIVLTRLARMRAERALPLGAFEQKVKRLWAEELTPRGLMLLFRELSDGRIRFIIKDSATHAFVHMLEYPSTAPANKNGGNQFNPESKDQISGYQRTSLE